MKEMIEQFVHRKREASWPVLQGMADLLCDLLESER